MEDPVFRRLWSSSDSNEEEKGKVASIKREKNPFEAMSPSSIVRAVVSIASLRDNYKRDAVTRIGSPRGGGRALKVSFHLGEALPRGPRKKFLNYGEGFLKRKRGYLFQIKKKRMFRQRGYRGKTFRERGELRRKLFGAHLFPSGGAAEVLPQGREVHSHERKRDQSLLGKKRVDAFSGKELRNILHGMGRAGGLSFFRRIKITDDMRIRSPERKSRKRG